MDRQLLAWAATKSVVLPLSAQDHVTGTAFQTLAALIAQPVVGCGVQVRLSAGFATRADTGELGGLLGQADAAMYRAKRSGGGLRHTGQGSTTTRVVAVAIGRVELTRSREPDPAGMRARGRRRERP